MFKNLYVNLKSEKNCNIGKIRSDHGQEHENANFCKSL